MYHQLYLPFIPIFAHYRSTSDPATHVISLPQPWQYEKLHLSCPDNSAPVLWAPEDSDRLCLQRQFPPENNTKDESQACSPTSPPGQLRQGKCQQSSRGPSPLINFSLVFSVVLLLYTPPIVEAYFSPISLPTILALYGSPLKQALAGHGSDLK